MTLITVLVASVGKNAELGAALEKVAQEQGAEVRVQNLVELELPLYSTIAEKNGITNYEADESTYRGIGKGLKRARISGVRYQEMRDSLGGTIPRARDWIDAGYGG